MARAVNPRRPYNSAKRRAQAQATRQEIVTAARELFVTRGYGRTTIDAIATEAGVAPETVYAGFKSKRVFLRQLLEIAAVGDEQPIPMRDRSWVHSLQAEADPSARVRLFAHEGSKILERSTDLLLVLRDAANSDDALAADWAEVNQRMLYDHALFARALAGENALRAGLTVQTATDVIWTIGSPEVYQRLVRWRGWTRQQYEEWSARVLQDTLFG
jgi:AcrR family transcriptional regulator